MGHEVWQKALDYLATHQVMTLATYGADGVWASAVFYVNDRFTFYFLSAGHTRHGRNMSDNKRVAATIQEDYRDWAAIQGIQLEGVVALLTGAEQAEAIRRYQQKFPFVAADAGLQAALSKVNWYRLTAVRLYFIDNSQGLGHRDEIVLV